MKKIVLTKIKIVIISSKSLDIKASFFTKWLIHKLIKMFNYFINANEIYDEWKIEKRKNPNNLLSVFQNKTSLLETFLRISAGANSMIVAVSSTVFDVCCSFEIFDYNYNFVLNMYVFYLFVHPWLEAFCCRPVQLLGFLFFIQQSRSQDWAVSWTRRFSYIFAFNIDSGDIRFTVYQDRFLMVP